MKIHQLSASQANVRWLYVPVSTTTTTFSPEAHTAKKSPSHHVIFVYYWGQKVFFPKGKHICHCSKIKFKLKNHYRHKIWGYVINTVFDTSVTFLENVSVWLETTIVIHYKTWIHIFKIIFFNSEFSFLFSPVFNMNYCLFMCVWLPYSVLFRILYLISRKFLKQEVISLHCQMI